jgi:lipopolysaccharide transport system ATP-binding protein
MSTAIKVENLSKIYRLGEIGTGTITQDIDRWFKTKVMGKEDPFMKIGESNDRAKKGNSDFVYSLQDINFEINQGDAVGIIGRNGAGKSTLLKILSRVTTPTTGKINIKGRVASLLEVGTGFHPELTGRENIYLNGAILGMRKREIDRKLDEIIDFSGVERYIDTPVKRYSSGMYVRLAFAVAAHLESEILIVDEVLAVGDAEFQKKCLGKMGEVSKGEGKTILFVSHSLTSIKSLCHKGILLEHGCLNIFGSVEGVLNKYMSSYNRGLTLNNLKFSGDLFNLFYISISGSSQNKLINNDIIKIQMSLEILSIKELYFVVKVKNDLGDYIFTTTSIDSNIDLEGNVIVEMIIPEGFFIEGLYRLDLLILVKNQPPELIFERRDILTFEIEQAARPLGSWMGREDGYFMPVFRWGNVYE